MLIFLGVVNPTNLTNLSDLTSDLRETSIGSKHVMYFNVDIAGKGWFCDECDLHYYPNYSYKHMGLRLLRSSYCTTVGARHDNQ